MIKPIFKTISAIALAITALNVSSDTGCVDSGIIGPALITDVCWECMFPIRVAGASMSGSSGSAPVGAVDNSLCVCYDGLGVPRPGITTSLWEPARLIEFQRIPGCSSVLNGTVLPFNKSNIGDHGNGEYDSGDGLFMHYHYYAFPLMIMLDMYVRGSCNPDGYQDLDLMYLSEVDPTWNSDELAFFTNPEAAAVANPIAQEACAVDAVSSNSGAPLDSMWWCAGSWGPVYPLSGNGAGYNGTIQDSSLKTVKVLAAIHRRGLGFTTMGEDAMCEANRSPFLPKAQYKFSMIYPMPETSRAHLIGESTLIWGNNRKVPTTGEDPIYIIWRWNDCCST